MAEEAPGLGSTLSVRGVDTAAASEERKKLRRSVGRLDTAFLMLAAIIVLDTLGAVSSYGAQTFTWLIVMVITAMATFSTFFITLSLAWQYVFGLIFDLEGFELPSAASEELTNPRKDVPLAILRSGIGTVLFYGVPILAILLVLPPAQLSNVSGFLDALKTVFVVYGGHTASSGAVLTGAGKVLADIAAIGVIFGLLSSGVVWLIGSDRTQAVAGFDGAAPRWMGYFSKRLGTPIAVNLLSGIVSTGILVLALTLTSGNSATSADSSLPSGFTGQRLKYELSQLIPLAVMVLIGLLFYALGRRTRQ